MGTLPPPVDSTPPSVLPTSVSPSPVSESLSPLSPTGALLLSSPFSSPSPFDSSDLPSPSPFSEAEEDIPVEPSEDLPVDSPVSPPEPSSPSEFSSSVERSSIHLQISSARDRTSSTVSSSAVFLTNTFSSLENVKPFCFLKNRLMRSITVSLEMSSPSISKKFFSPSSAYPRLKIPTEPGYFFWTIFSMRASSRMFTTPLLRLREITSSIISRGVQSA